MAGGREFDNGKFKELVLLFAERSKDDPLMGRVKLNKLLYYADFEAYRRLGRSITGAIYVHGEHGPMAADLPRAEEELGNAGYLGWRPQEAGPHTQKIPVALEGPDERQFSQEEFAVIEDALRELKDLGGFEAREWSHRNSAGWNLVDPEDPIPYETIFLSMKRPPEELFRHAERLSKERKWDEVRP